MYSNTSNTLVFRLDQVSHFIGKGAKNDMLISGTKSDTTLNQSLPCVGCSHSFVMRCVCLRAVRLRGHDIMGYGATYCEKYSILNLPVTVY